MMIDTTKLYILMLLCMILTLIQGHWDVRKRKLRANYPTKLLMDFDGVWHAVETFWYNKSNNQFLIHVSIMWIYVMSRVQLADHLA